RFLLINTVNKGVSAARNLGIQLVDTEYVTFVDSDDYLNNSYLQEIVANIEDFDFIVSGYKIIDNEGTIKETRLPKAGVYSRNVLISKIITDPKVFSVPWNKVFKTDIVKKNNIYFNENINYGEDLIFNNLYNQQ